MAITSIRAVILGLWLGPSQWGCIWIVPISRSSYSTGQVEIQNLPEKLFNQINMCHNHSAAAIAFASELVHGIA